MRAVTGKPIKLLGTGEKIRRAGGFPSFGRVAEPHPRHGRHRLASSRRRRRTSTWPKMRPRRPKKLRKGVFDLDDLAEPAAARWRRWAAWVRHASNMLPGVGQMKKASWPAPIIDEKVFERQVAIINVDDHARGTAPTPTC
jgi:signal recognition particle GTPase